MTNALTIAEVSARCGLPQSTIRYWERIGLLPRVQRDPSSGHRRYSLGLAEQLETLANLRSVGMSINDMRAYLDGQQRGDAAAGEQRALFQTHADRLTDQLASLQLRHSYLELKVQYWAAREAGDLARADAVADRLRAVIAQLTPRTNPTEKDS
ncbi:MerR family transcriptional regulator [Nocardioides sp. LHG3406-4]|uniref:MerR family transcriptional regulator n=1 Tax=Nocardioides sp. LHG3406-4 TaxID=2804575 RepID=UPI003CE7C187